MKKILLVILSMITVANGFGQLYPTFSYPSSVDLFGLCEISFLLPKIYSNPYDPDTISVYAVFTGPDNSSDTVNAFYYEDYTFQKHNTEYYEIATHNPLRDGWRIRFTPNKVGTWTFRIRAFDANGELNRPFMNVDHTFSCTSVSDADGFISKANSRFLKRDIVRNGQRQFHSFFPIGPNVAWYSCIDYWSFKKPRGIYEYEMHIDSLYGNANYMRIWLNRFQFLSLFGPEFTQMENGSQKVYFDSIVNQKDSAELDHIVTYAMQHGIVIMPSIFTIGSFEYVNNLEPGDPNKWENNPFNTILGLSNPCCFFTNEDAIRITKNLIRYIVSRWGYATNIMCWELWNEVDFMTDLCMDCEDIDQIINEWHYEMADYIRNIDPFGHCVSSSIGKYYSNPMFPNFYQNLDIVQQHNYQNIHNASSKFEIPNCLFLGTNYGHNIHPSKPFFIGEFGYSSRNLSELKDPKGISLHNSLWSSLFSTSIGPASFWWWEYLDSLGLYKRFSPLKNFCKNLPIYSGTFRGFRTGTQIENEIEFPNGLETYYMINGNEDTIVGWSQDTAFAYQSLRRLTDSVRVEYDTLSNGSLRPRYYFKDDVPPFDPDGYVYTLNSSKKPAPSSNSNIITLPITNQPVRSRYQVIWYDTETGNAFLGITTYTYVQQDAQGNKYLSISFPSSIRNLQQHTINNTFGDAVFLLVLKNPIN
jgi:hypothetical protein